MGEKRKGRMPTIYLLKSCCTLAVRLPLLLLYLIAGQYNNLKALHTFYYTKSQTPLF